MGLIRLLHLISDNYLKLESSSYAFRLYKPRWPCPFSELLGRFWRCNMVGILYAFAGSNSPLCHLGLEGLALMMAYLIIALVTWWSEGVAA